MAIKEFDASDSFTEGSAGALGRASWKGAWLSPQEDTCPAFEMEIFMEMGFLKKHNVAGADSLSLFFFKNGGQLLKSETKNC